MSNIIIFVCVFAWKFHISCGVYVVAHAFQKSKLMAIKKDERKKKSNHIWTKPEKHFWLCLFCTHTYTKTKNSLEIQREKLIFPFHYLIQCNQSTMQCNNSCATAIIASFPHDDFSIIIILIVMLMGASVYIANKRARQRSSSWFWLCQAQALESWVRAPTFQV